MFNTRVSRGHYLVTALVLVAFVIAGHFANLAMMRMGQAPRIDQPLFFSRLIRTMDPKDPVHGLALLEAAKENGGGPPFDLSIADADGKIIYPPSHVGGMAWEGPTPKLAEGQMEQEKGPSGSPSASFFFSTFLGGRPPPPPQDAIVRLHGEPTRYLVSRRTHVPPPGAKPIFFSFAILITSILGGAGVSLMILFERIRASDQNRMQLLQELGHDLRTPVASLKNMLETLATKGQTLDPKIGRELMDLSLREVDYFERLIEDLLVLAQIDEPNYRCVRKPTDLSSLVEEEAELLLSRRGGGSSRKIDVARPREPVQVSGDAHLLRRAVRNALENAFDFSKKNITVEFGHDGTGLTKLEVRDDGPGFSPDQLAKFGERRMTRHFGTQREGRISIGLGSVIMKTILDIHRGSLVAENWTGSDGRPGGARVILRVPAA